MKKFSYNCENLLQESVRYFIIDFSSFGLIPPTSNGTQISLGPKLMIMFLISSFINLTFRGVSWGQKRKNNENDAAERVIMSETHVPDQEHWILTDGTDSGVPTNLWDKADLSQSAELIHYTE